MEEIQKAKDRKNNIKLYPIYQMIGYDWMFYFSISLLFYVQVKHLTNSEVVLLDSFYAFFSMIGYGISTIIVAEIGKKNAMVLGNLLNILGISTIILGNTYAHFIIANFIAAMGFALKGVSESAFLHKTVPDSANKSDICTKIQEKSYSKFSYFSAITMFLSGFLYDINPYIPLVCCLICIMATTVVASNFVEIDDTESKKQKKQREKEEIKEAFDEIVSGLKFVFRSKRLRSLIIMTNLMWGMLNLIISYRPMLLENIGVSVGIIGIVAAVSELAKGLFATKANKFHRKFKNKTLTILALTITLAMIFSGIVAIAPTDTVSKAIIIVFVFILIYAVKGIEQVIYKRYYGNFANEKILTKIYAADGIVAGFLRMITALIGAAVLNIMDIRFAMIFMGAILTLAVILASKYMKTRTGLKPEQYDKKDIEYISK
jgi:hypothetical protein